MTSMQLRVQRRLVIVEKTTPATALFLFWHEWECTLVNLLQGQSQICLECEHGSVQSV